MQDFIQKIERLRYFWILVLLYLIMPFFLFFNDFFLLRKLFYFFDIGSDTLNLYFPWLKHYALMESHGFWHWWSFYMGMGQIFPTFLVLEPAWFIFNHYVFFWKDAWMYSFHIIYFGEILVSAVVMYYFLRDLGLLRVVALAGALLWQFSGYMIIGAAWYVFPYYTMAGSFIFLGLEKIFKGKNPVWFIYGVYLLSYNLYFFLTYGMFFLLYFIARAVELQLSGKQLRRVLITIIGVGILAVLADMVNLLPRWQQIIFSPRVEGEVSPFKMLLANPEPVGWAKRVATTILRFFGNDMAGYATGTQIWRNYLEAPAFYVGLLSLLLLPQFFVYASRRKKLIWGIFLGFWLIVAFVPIVRHAVNLFAGNYFRGTIDFFLSATLLIIAMRGFDYVLRQKKINMKLLIASVVFYAGMILLAQVIDDIRTRKFLILLVLAFMIVYGYLLFLLTTDYYRWGIILLLVVLPLEAGYLSQPAYYHRMVADSSFEYNWGGYRDNTIMALEIIRREDTSKFFRVEKDYRSGQAIHGSTNDAMVQDYFGTASYNSFNNLNYIRFLEYEGIIQPGSLSQTQWAQGVVGYPLAMSLVGVKYFLTKDFNSPMLKLGFSIVDTAGDVLVLKNNYALPLAFGYDKVIVDKLFLKLDKIRRQIAMLMACVIDSKDTGYFRDFVFIDTSAVYLQQTFSFEDYIKQIDSLKSLNVKVLSFRHDEIRLRAENSSRRILVFSIPYDRGWHVYDNGKKLHTYRVDGGLLAIIISPGKHNIKLVFRTVFYWPSLIISVISLLIITVLVVLWKRK